MLHLSVAEGVHRVEDAYTNWYVLQDDGALTVVDTGHPRSWDSLQELLHALRRDAGAVEAVVLDALAAVDADVVLTGHGEPWTQGTKLAVERARAAGPS